MKHEYDSLIKKMNTKWNYLSTNLTNDITRICENESVRMVQIEHQAVRFNKIFNDSITGFYTTLKNNGHRDSLDIREIGGVKTRNLFAKRVIPGFPISWFNRRVEDKYFKEALERMLESEMRSPFYDM